jgi:NAD(P)-dependent dehydrogenase (short-subunit alcohol dehydrogenase family)
MAIPTGPSLAMYQQSRSTLGFSAAVSPNVAAMTKTVMITGAGSGFGKMASLALAERGHEVIATTETDGQADLLRSEAPQLTMERVDITSDDVAKGSGRVIIMFSISGVMSAPTFRPYSMTKHALEAMGKTMRSELAPLGIDVTLMNPGPYQTGFNDRMPDSKWEWFDEASLNASASDSFREFGRFVTGNQMDPAEVSRRTVELTESETTEENNFVPPEIRALVTGALEG